MPAQFKAVAMTSRMTHHPHDWRQSVNLLGLVGSLYRNIYPWACRCGALKNADGSVLEPTRGQKV